MQLSNINLLAVTRGAFYTFLEPFSVDDLEVVDLEATD